MCAIPEGSTLMTHSPPKTSPLTIILGIRFQHMKDWGVLAHSNSFCGNYSVVVRVVWGGGNLRAFHPKVAEIRA